MYNLYGKYVSSNLSSLSKKELFQILTNNFSHGIGYNLPKELVGFGQGMFMMTTI